MRPIRLILATSLVAAVVVVAAAAPAGAAGGLTELDGAYIAFDGAYTPAVASNGTEALVVWETRNGQGGLADIYGRLVATDGSQFRVDTVRVSRRAADEYAPDIAWNGSSFLVVWETQISDGRQEIHGRRVSRNGAVLGSEIAIATRNGEQHTPAVTAGPNGQFLVAWEDDRNFATTETDVYARRISANGTPLDGGGVRMSFDRSDEVSDDLDPDVAWNGSRYLVVYTALAEDTQARSIRAGALSSTGQFGFVGVVGPAVVGDDRTYDALHPAVAAGGDRFVVVWQQAYPGSNGLDIVGTRLDGPAPSSWHPFAVSTAVADQLDPTIAFNGQFLVVWRDRRRSAYELWGAQVAPNGVVRETAGFGIVAAPPATGGPALTRGSGDAQTFTLAWEDDPNTETTDIGALGLGPAPK